MILIDKPFVSDFLRNTIDKNQLPLVKTDVAIELGFHEGKNLYEEESAIDKIHNTKNIKIYTSSENSIGWIAKHLKKTGLPSKIELFKDKAKFRTMIKPMYPDFFFAEIPIKELNNLDINNIPCPFIIKPNVGFFSLGVHKVTKADEWPVIKNLILQDLHKIESLYPQEVLSTSSFIIEECIDGDEFAFDAYYGHDGKPVILSILNHLFSSEKDVSDRVYISSKKIIEENLDQFTDFLIEIGKLANVKNFPLHVEIRRNNDGLIQPIEINPMRFGGWCTTADLMYFAYGFNPYLYYFSQKQPDWKTLLASKSDKLYSLIVLDNSSGIEGNQIKSFDYDGLMKTFSKPLELRKADYKKFPIFGFIFSETQKDNYKELDNILKNDLLDYIRTK